MLTPNGREKRRGFRVFFKIFCSKYAQNTLDPGLAEQKLISNLLADAMRRLSAVSDVHAELRSAIDDLDQSILAKAFRGELVPQDPRDEPASILLERIRKQRETAGAATKNGKAATRRSATKKAAET